MLVACKNKEEIDRLKTQLSLEFEIKDLGKAKKILVMEIARDRLKCTIHLTQKQYLTKKLQHFGMDSKTKLVRTPLARHFKLSALLSPRTNEERENMAQVPYVSVVGSLMYAMVCT